MAKASALLTQTCYKINTVLLLFVLLFCDLQYGNGFSLVDPDIARTVLCIFWMLAEPVRLAAGWYGNLQENVSARG
jgi:hypothetical protein